MQMEGTEMKKKLKTFKYEVKETKCKPFDVYEMLTENNNALLYYFQNFNNLGNFSDLDHKKTETETETPKKGKEQKWFVFLDDGHECAWIEHFTTKKEALACIKEHKGLYTELIKGKVIK